MSNSTECSGASNIPLSTCCFRTAMKKCRTKVSTQSEERRQNKIQEEARKRKEKKARQGAVNEATSLPCQAADKRIEEKLDEKLQPLLDKVRSLEEQLHNPTAKDQDGADARSTAKKRKKSKSIRVTECVEASSETKKRKHRPAAEQMLGSSVSSRPGGPSRQEDRPKWTESGGKRRTTGKGKKPRVTYGDQE